MRVGSSVFALSDVAFNAAAMKTRHLLARTPTRLARLATGLLLSVIGSQALAQAQFFDPSAYLRAADTPAGFGAGAYVENFEDQHVHVDLVLQGTLQAAGPATDSVDADDGVVDDDGRNGVSFRDSTQIRVRFKTLPTSAGLVVTDVAAPITFEAFDGSGQSLGIRGPFALPVGSNGSTSADRFVGVRDTGGIGAIEVRASGDIEVDHVQWTVSAPTSTGGALPVPRLQPERAASLRDVALQADAKLLLLGEINLGASSAQLVRLNASGELDGNFAIPAASAISSGRKLLLDAQQRIYVLDADRVRRFLPTGAVDSSFVANVSFGNTLTDMALVADGVLVVGAFTQVTAPGGPFPRSRIAKLNADGSLNTSFVLGADATVLRVVASGQEAFVAGAFATIGSTARAGVAKIASSGAGSLINEWDAQLAVPSTTPQVNELALIGNELYLSGRFATVLGEARNRIAKLSAAPTALLDPSWNVSSSLPASVLFNTRFHHQNGALYVLGETLRNPPAAPHASGITKLALSGAGAIDASFVVQSQGTIAALTSGDAATRIVVAGGFTGIDGQPRFSLAQLTATGGLDGARTLFEPIRGARVSDLSIDAVNGRVYLVGDFDRFNGANRKRLVRLVGGELDLGWVPDIALDASNFSTPRRVTVMPGLGVFADVNGLARYNESDGARVPGWTFPVNTPIQAIAATPAAVYASVSVTGQLQRLLYNGGGIADPGFVGAASVDDLKYDANSDSVLAIGTFSTIGGLARPRIALLDGATGQVRADFDPNFQLSAAPATPKGYALDGLGGLLVAGGFDQANGQTTSFVRLLLGTGDNDPNLLPVTAAARIIGLHSQQIYLARADEVVRVPSSGGALDPAWGIRATATPGANLANSLALTGQGSELWLTGSFAAVAGRAQSTIALLPVEERLFSDGLE